MAARLIGAVVGVIAATAIGSAAAQDVCVDCKDPDRNYRCTVKDSERVHHIRGSSRALEFVCISEIARAGGHQSCRVNTAYAGPCIGQHHEIDLARRAPTSDIVVGRPPQPDAGSGAPQPTAAGSPAPGAAAPPAQPKGPPQTVEELARETVAKSKEQLSAADEQVRKAGDAVGGAVKKTWECVASLFSRC